MKKQKNIAHTKEKKQSMENDQNDPDVKFSKQEI